MAGLDNGAETGRTDNSSVAEISGDEISDVGSSVAEISDARAHSDNFQNEQLVDFGASEVGASSKQGFVDQIFSRVAGRYDLMNDLMSFGMHRLWKDSLIAWLAPPKSGGWRILDCAAGSGDISTRILEASPHSRPVLYDVNFDMLGQAVARAQQQPKPWQNASFAVGSAEKLPFESDSFDAYVVSFGIRNFTSRAQALSEAWRVLKPGGKFLCLEFSTVQPAPFDEVYEAYSRRVIPAMGELVAGDRASYQYLVESIKRFPAQREFSAEIENAGFSLVKCRNLMGGVAALHCAWKV